MDNIIFSVINRYYSASYVATIISTNLYSKDFTILLSRCCSFELIGYPYCAKNHHSSLKIVYFFARAACQDIQLAVL